MKNNVFLKLIFLFLFLNFTVPGSTASSVSNKKVAHLPESTFYKEKLLEWYAPFVHNRLRTLPETEITKMIKISWESIINDPDHTLVNIFLILSEKGALTAAFKKIMDLLIGLGIDVSNPWALIAEMKDFVPSESSLVLFGEDLGQYEETIRDYSANKNLDISNDHTLSKVNLMPSMQLNDIREAYHELLGLVAQCPSHQI